MNTRVWALWVAAASSLALSSRNPLYLVVALLATGIVRSSLVENARERSLPAWRFGVVLIVMATAWNALTTHYGETVLFQLPEALPLIGGRVTLEAVVFGLSGGLAVWLLIAAFSTFSAAVTPYGILSLAPRALRHAGLIVSIALTFLPQALRTAGDVREAQAVRGYRPRRIRDLTATVVPLLLNSLENAMRLAEAMEARGYGRASAAQSGVAWLCLLAGALVQLYWRESILGGCAMVLGAGWLFASARRTEPITRYRRERWTARDVFVALESSACFIAIGIVATYDPSALSYYPYPRVTAPPANPEIVVALLALAAPAMRLPRLRQVGREPISET